MATSLPEDNGLPQCRHCSALLKGRDIKECPECNNPTDRPMSTSSSKQISTGRACPHCNARFLSPEATICHSCRQQRRRRQHRRQRATTISHVVHDRDVEMEHDHKKHTQPQVVTPQLEGVLSASLPAPYVGESSLSGESAVDPLPDPNRTPPHGQRIHMHSHDAETDSDRIHSTSGEQYSVDHELTHSPQSTERDVSETRMPAQYSASSPRPQETLPRPDSIQQLGGDQYYVSDSDNWTEVHHLQETNADQHRQLSNGLGQDTRNDQRKQLSKGHGQKTALPSRVQHHHDCFHKHSWPYIKGLDAPPGKEIKVIFHAVLPKSIWNWDSHRCCMHIRFGHRHLGSWEVDCGVFQESESGRDAELCEMTCVFDKFNLDILSEGFPYKYTIHTPASQGSVYEYLQAYPDSNDYDRYLKLPQLQQAQNQRLGLHGGGLYHQYDTMVYPKTEDSSGTWWKFSHRSDVSQDGIKPSPPLRSRDISSVCLNIYLERDKNSLSKGEFLDVDMGVLYERIQHVYRSLEQQWICAPRIKAKKETLDKWFREDLMDWLLTIVNDNLIQSQTINQVQKLLVAAFIIIAIGKKTLYKFLDAKRAVQLAQMLALEPDITSKSCPMFSELCSFLITEQRNFIHYPVRKLLELIAKLGREDSIFLWFQLLPLYHFTMLKEVLDHRVEPFQDSERDVTEFFSRETPPKKFEEKIFPGIRELKCKTDITKGFVRIYYELYLDYFRFDPLLQEAFVYLCPKSELFLLFEKIPPFLSVAWVANRASLIDVKTFDQMDANEYTDLLKSTRKACSYPSHKRPRLLLSLVKTSALLFQDFTHVLRTRKHYCLSLIVTSVSLVLSAISQMDDQWDHEQCQKGIREALATMRESLREWIADAKVIGGSVFGQSVASRKNPTWRGETELKTWQTLLFADVVPNSIAERGWHSVIKDLVQQRINSVRSETVKIDLVCVMENIPDVHPVLADAVMEAAFLAIDRLMKQPQETEQKFLQRLTEASYESEHVGKLLGRLMEMEYPKDNKELTFDHLLQWHLWPNFIKIIVDQSKIKNSLPKQCEIHCVLAHSVLQNICDEIKHGTVTVKNMRKIGQQLEQMTRLCQAVSPLGKEVKVRERLEEFKMFESCHIHLAHLSSHISPHVQGFSELQAEVLKDWNSEQIGQLCSRDEHQQVAVKCFKTASPDLISVAEKFYTLTQSHQGGSDLFIDAWKREMKSAVSKLRYVTLQDVAVHVWRPSFEHCQELLTSLVSLQIKLSDVDEYFGHQRFDRRLETQLNSLLNGLKICNANLSNITQFEINERAGRVRQYWRLCQYRQVANIFLKLRVVLNLHGNFHPVERLSSQLTSSIEDCILENVDESLVEAGNFLEEITKDKKKVDCLRIFAECQEIVCWLRDFTTDVNDIQNFVNVSLATAAGGEDDYAQDKLSHLSTIGNGFGSLIYKLPSDAGYQELCHHCVPLWEALGKSDNLPNLLKDCNTQVGWYQSVKDTQGPVEETSYGRMGDILLYGRYNIGNSCGNTVHGIQDMITLKLSERDQKLPKTVYNLEELRDLESRLVLITGSKAKNRAEVDFFLNTLSQVSRIAEVLLDLQQAGNIMYLGWELEFNMFSVREATSPSLSMGLINQLQVQAVKMEREVESWKHEVKKARENYYELNYYTTLQLLTLRKALGKVQKGPQLACKHSNLALLQCISTKVSGPCIQETVEGILQQRSRSPSVDIAIHCMQVIESDSRSSMEEQKEIETQPTTCSLQAEPEVGSVSHIAMPTTTLDELTDEQRQFVVTIKDHYGYSTTLLLKAFDECGGDAKRFDIERWCTDNVDEYNFNGSDGEGDTDDDDKTSFDGFSSPDESDSDESIEPIPTTAVASSTPVSKRASLDSSCFKIVEKRAISESHPDVQKLVGAGYETGNAIEAMKHCKTIPEALDFLESETEGDSFLPVEPQAGVTDARKLSTVDDCEIVVFREFQTEDGYLSLDELGNVLKSLSAQFPPTICGERPFNKSTLKVGSPNLVVTAPENVLHAVLALYMEDFSLPLPTFEEVLICDSSTSAEEVSIFWQRAFGDPGFRRIFCLVHAEKLSYQVCDQAIRSLTDSEVSPRKEGIPYRLVIVCSKDNDKSHIISKLHLFNKPYVFEFDRSQYQEYLKAHFVSFGESKDGAISASTVDCEKSCVRMITSQRSGMGKSLCIKRMAEKLSTLNNQTVESVLVVVPIHGPTVSPEAILDFLTEVNVEGPDCKLFHIDIAPSILHKVDAILFSLLILRGLSDGQGRVWRSKPSQLYALEVTIANPDQRDISESKTVSLLNLLPSVQCVGPQQVLELSEPTKLVIAMDDQEFRSSPYQRVYQYLRRHAENVCMDKFMYEIGSVEGNPSHCLECILRNCGIADPSWSEIHHFVQFLDVQLQSCEQSVFCNRELVGDTMPKFKEFVVKFMIRMSKDFAVSSLQDKKQTQEEKNYLEQYQIANSRRWERSSHPFIFFNQDGNCITVVGLKVIWDGTCDLCDPVSGVVLESNIMNPVLYRGLRRNRVHFDNEYEEWLNEVAKELNKKVTEIMSVDWNSLDETHFQKAFMVDKLATVMGIENPRDPDESYVLTTDNVIKILAIQMRFRCGIPVIIMGETGCGKTRLIRYMCDLAKGIDCRENMLIKKIHGGTTESELVAFVTQAEEVAKQNMNIYCSREGDDVQVSETAKANMDTVVFFDEANTTDAVGIIKEIMCDRRLNGVPISKHLKFIAACNPYRKHSKEMIEKLESAGLGFYVQAKDSRQKLGTVPLRQLVYRVLDLPPSMRPLVYDFGQLNTGTEQEYIQQIVKDHVTKHPGLPSDNVNIIIPTISNVLVWSQAYMRSRKDECSYVSLRDVERAMMVFEYFYEKRNVFGPLSKDWARRNDMELKAPVIRMPKQETFEGSVEVMNDLDASVEAGNDLSKGVSGSEARGKRPEVEHLQSFKTQSEIEDGNNAETVPQDGGVVYHDLDAISRALLLSLSVCYHARLQDRHEYEIGISKEFKNPLSLPGGVDQFRNEIRWCQEALLDNMVLGSHIARNAALRENVFMMTICVELRIPLFLVGKPGSSKSLAKSIVQKSLQGKHSNSKLLRQFKRVHMFSYQCSQLSTSESVIEVFNTAKHFQKNEDTREFVSAVVLDEVGLAEDSPNLPLKALHPLLEDGTQRRRTIDVDIAGQEERVAFIGISNWALDPAKMNRGVMVTRGTPDITELEQSARGICSSIREDHNQLRLESYFRPLAEAYMTICEKQKRDFFGLRDFYSLVKMLYWMCEKSGGKPLTWPQFEHAVKRNFGGLESEDLNPFEEFKKRINLINTLSDFDDVSAEMQPIVNPDCSRLGLIRTSLSNKDISFHGENRYLLFLTENYAALGILEHYLHDTSNASESETALKPFVLFGSSFPKDREYTQVCRNINQIKICMESGRTVILLNLENLYESLYDVLNQYYIFYGDVRYVDLGLQTHRVKCRVHNNFKLILIAEKDTVYEKFPTPLINRLEKHFVLTSSVLNEWQLDVMHSVQTWIHNYSTLSTSTDNFSEGDAFIGFQNDTPAAVVFEAAKLLKSKSPIVIKVIEQLRQADMVEDDPPERLFEEPEGSEMWKLTVLKLSQYLLLQTTSDDALVRLKRTCLAEEQQKYVQLYYKLQHHQSIQDFVQYNLSCERDCQSGLLMQITTHSHFLTPKELRDIGEGLSMDLEVFFLDQFDTELDFSNKVGPMFTRQSKNSCLIVIQCDLGHLKGDLIACARHRIYDERVKYKDEGDISNTHILFIVQLPHRVAKSTFVSFQGDPWISAHIDDLRHLLDATFHPDNIFSANISDIFRNEAEGELERLDMACVKVHVRHQKERKEETNDEQLSPTDGDATTAVASLTFKDIQRHHYARLHGCIQAAASRVHETSLRKNRSTQRVYILLKLLSEVSSLPNDERRFYQSLVNHIYIRLKEMEEQLDMKEWVLNEAMNPMNLQHGGTFRNVLSRKVDEAIIPIFSQIVALIDKHCNLNLVRQCSSISKLWLDIFQEPCVMKFSYGEMVSPRETLPGDNSGMSEENFHCQFPFSWIIKSTVDSQWENIHKGRSKQKRHSQLCRLLQQTSIREPLESVSVDDVESFFQFYMHDYVRTVHKSACKDKQIAEREFELVSDTLAELVNSPKFYQGDAHAKATLLSKITALQVVYVERKPRFVLFSQLASQHPGIVESLKEKLGTESSEMELLMAKMVLSSLEPPFEKDEPTQDLRSWLNYIRLSHNTLNSIVNLPSMSPLADEVRRAWHRLCALQMFVEHVLLKHSQLKLVLFTARRLSLHLENTDFLQAKTLKRVKKQLNAMDKEMKRKVRDSKKRREIKKSCHEFFMELVSSLCFGGAELPEAELIEELINTMFNENESFTTQDLTPYDESKVDRNPTIRSLLLQLLLEHSTEQVKSHLESYFARSTQVLQSPSGQCDQSLCLLCIQCFEDALSKQFCSQRQLQNRIDETVIVARSGHEALNSHHHVSLGYLEGVAKVRFALSVIAELFNKGCIGESSELVKETSGLCIDVAINQIDPFGTKDSVGPAVYLLKLLIKQYGFYCLDKTIQSHPWVLPEVLKDMYMHMAQKPLDPFVIYDQTYCDIRELVKGAVFDKQEMSLQEATKDLQPMQQGILLIALYEKVTLSHGCPEQLQHDVLERMNTFVVESSVFSEEIKLFAKTLIANQQGGPLAQLAITSNQPLYCKTLGAVVIHTAVALKIKQGMHILQPFVNMLSNPSVLNNCYLPTMQEDVFVGVATALRDSEVDCGRPWHQEAYNDCGSDIGDLWHELQTHIPPFLDPEISQTGYILGSPDGRTGVPAAERKLSSSAVCVISAIMHAVLIWACCNNDSVVEAIAQLVKPPMPPRDLPEFFWRHLEKDIEQLGRTTGRGMDESAMILHLVLKEIMMNERLTIFTVQSTSLLKSKEAREVWEDSFCQEYIQPVLSELDQTISKAMETVTNDSERGFVRLAYESSELPGESIHPHLWTVHPRITLDQIGKSLMEKKMRGKYPILHEFLQAEPNLRATQYLPDIVQLQRSLYAKFHRRLRQEDAAVTTIEQFMTQFGSDSERTKYRKMLESLKSAWALVGPKLRTHSLLPVEQKYLDEFTKKETLEYIIPTYSGAGRCTVALVNFLKLCHNSFIERCRTIVMGENESVSSFWEMHEIPLSHVQPSHVLEYEHQLIPVVLSHCHYSLTFGKGQKVNYDHKAMEKHILDRFIHGKPLIAGGITPVQYQRDIYTTDIFSAVREKVSPQLALSSRDQHEIIAELRTPVKIRESLDVVDVLLRFLSSGAGNAEQSLGEYINKLKMKSKPFSSKAKHCQLKHILSLWRTLSVELARQLYRQGQDPFDAIKVEFQLELASEEKVELDKCLGSLDTARLLGTLYEFIETFVKHSEGNSRQWTLIEHLGKVVDTYKWQPIPQFKEEFPSTIRLEQAVATWKYIIDYQKRHKS